MKPKILRSTVAIAAIYFSGNLYAQETDTLQNVHFFIGSNIAKMLDKKIKNK